jgi:hypothetical protein
MAYRVLVKNAVPLQNEMTGALEPPGMIYGVVGKQDSRPVGKRIGRPVYEYVLMAHPGTLEGLGFEDLHEADQVMRQVTSIPTDDDRGVKYTHFQLDGPKTFPNSRANLMGPPGPLIPGGWRE